MKKKEFKKFSCYFYIILLFFIPFVSAANINSASEINIRWTNYGIPHITAQNEYALGYGTGYVYARDNGCLLMNEILTVRGERARYFGEGGESSTNINNVTSDFFFTWFNSASAVDAFWEVQPKEIRDLLKGYAAGFNLFHAEDHSKALSCHNKSWLSNISEKDLVRLTRRLLIEAGLAQFAESLVGAQPSKSWLQWLKDKLANIGISNKYSQITQAKWQGNLTSGMGSNAVAIGKNRSPNGKGMLLANPHFPWNGAMRFYQMHLTIPGQLDVMGASLPGMPLINIGFNHDMAWTHTVDTSTHFTLYRLQLDEQDNRKYIIDGKSYPLEKQTLQIKVLDEQGSLSTLSHDFYQSEFGPLVTWPGFLNWDNEHAYALRDANVGNTRVLQQWYEINKSKDTKALRNSVEKIQGIPWVNTLATDSKGQALYMNQSVVPYLLPEQLSSCKIDFLFKEGIAGLEGNTKYCNWYSDSSVNQGGITPADKMPSLLSDEFVQNSNDSAWLTNPDTPLINYSPLITLRNESLRLRTRFGLSRLVDVKVFSAQYLEDMITDNQVYLADLVLDDLLKFCRTPANSENYKVACHHLNQWDGKANIDSSLGLVYFEYVMDSFMNREQMWRIPFDKNDPINTPRGLALDESRVTKQIRTALGEITEIVEGFELNSNATWGDLQLAKRGSEIIALPGGYGDLGIYNVLEPEREDYYSTIESERQITDVDKGSSYIQVVTFNDKGPVVKGLLALSQSSEASSPYFNDQTKLFSRQYWPMIPFTEEQISKAKVIEYKTLILP